MAAAERQRGLAVRSRATTPSGAQRDISRSLTEMPDPLNLPHPAVVVLAGPSGAGKTYWAEQHFHIDEIVSSDSLRGMVGESETDQRASKDAFAILDQVIRMRAARRLPTVIDTLGLNDEARASYLDLAREHELPAVLVLFDTPDAVCRKRNRSRAHPVPARVLSDQIKRYRSIRDRLEGEGFDRLVVIEESFESTITPRSRVTTEPAPASARDGLRFDLMISAFDFEGSPASTGKRLAALAPTAEEAGFTGIWVMDHFRQIPQLGREWEDMLESYTTLGYLAAHTTTARLGVLVTGVTYRNPAHLGKIVATLDVLSAGRAVCGLGAAWFEKEHLAYGWEFPSPKERLDLLEDALQLLPLMWGKGSPGFEGKRISVPEAMSYPRPLQDKIPIIVGGGGEKRTLDLVARYADGCNFLGGPDEVAHKLDVLQAHCAKVGRDVAEIEVTHLGSAIVARTHKELRDRVDLHRQGQASRADVAKRSGAGTVEEQVERFSALHASGVETAIVALPGLDEEALDSFAEVIARFDVSGNN